MPAPTDSVEIPNIPTSVVTAAGTDIHPVSQGGVTKQETNAQILSYIQGAVAIPVAQISDASANGRSLITAANYAAMLTLLGAAPLASPTFTGVPAAPTAAPGTNTTQLATTAFVLANAGVGSVTNVTASAPLASSGGATPDISFTGTLAAARGGTGVSNVGTLTNASNTTITGGGALALGGFTLTVPATGTSALLGTANVFTAAQAIAIADAVTNTVTTLATLTHNSSGTPAASFGSRLLFNLDSATVDDRNAAAIDVIWTTATDASRTSDMIWYMITNAGALTERMRLSGAGNLSGIASVGTFVWRDASANNWGLANASQFDFQRPIGVTLSDSGTAVATNVLTVAHTSSGTPAAGFGLAQLELLKSSTTAGQSAADETTTWVVATHASRTARKVFNIYDTAAREAMRIQASGSAAMIGLYGAAAVVQAAAITAPSGGAIIDAEARTAIASILTAIGAAAGGIGITA